MILGIYGSGGLGREVLALARHINATKPRWEGIVFVDDFNPVPEIARVRVIALAEARKEFSTANLEICVAVGEPALRAELANKIHEIGYRPATLIHPQVQIPEETAVGPGTIISHGCFVSCGVTLDNNVLLQPVASVGHDCRIGAHTVISTFVTLAGHCTIGSRTFIGMSVPVKEDSVIGDDVIVGMGSVVLRNIDSGMVALGNPARPMSVNHTKRVFRK